LKEKKGGVLTVVAPKRFEAGGIISNAEAQLLIKKAGGDSSESRTGAGTTNVPRTQRAGGQKHSHKGYANWGQTTMRESLRQSKTGEKNGGTRRADGGPPRPFSEDARSNPVLSTIRRQARMGERKYGTKKRRLCPLWEGKTKKKMKRKYSTSAAMRVPTGHEGQKRRGGGAEGEGQTPPFWWHCRQDEGSIEI